MPIRSVTLKIMGDDKSARAAIDWVSAKADEIDSRNPTLHIGVDTGTAEEKLAAVQSEIDSLRGKALDIRLLTDDNNVLASIDNMLLGLDKLGRKMSNPKVSIAGLIRAEAELAALGARAEKISGIVANAHVGIDEADFDRRLALIHVKLETLATAARKIRIGADDTQALAAVIQLETAIRALQATTKEIDFKANVDGIAAAEAKVLALGGSVKALSDYEKAAASNTSALGAMLGKLLPVKIVTGAAGLATWIHLWTDALVELGAVLVPAVGTMLLFGGALSATLPDIETAYQREVAMYTATDILGQKMFGLKGNLDQVSDSLKPGVWQVWGDGLTIVNNGVGLFSTMAHEAVNWVDRWAARITVDLTAGQGSLAKFINTGKRDLAALGTLLMTLSNAFMNLIRVSEQTHIAESLLGAITVAAKLLDLITKLPTPILATVVALHGLYLWGGMAVTALFRFASVIPGMRGVSKTLDGIAASALTARKGIPFVVSGLHGVGMEADGTATKTGILKTGLALLTKVPVWGWVGLGALAVTGLALAFTKTTDATDKFVNNLNRAIAKASNFSVFNMMVTGVGQIDKQLKAISTAWKEGQISIGLSSVKAAHDQGRLTGSLAKTSAEMNNYATGVGWIEKSYQVDYPTALALASAAHVKLTNNMIGTSKAAREQRQQIIGLMTGYTQLQGPTGIAGEDFRVLAVESNDITTKIQQLNSAWSSWMKNVTGTQSSFDTFAQGLTTLKSDSGTFTLHLGELTVKGKQTKAAIDSLTTSGINLNQAFVDEIGNADQYIGALRTSGVSQKTLTTAVKASVAALLPYAKGSKEATSQLYALAQQADYTGNNSFSSLSNWAGIKAPKALKVMKGAADQATTASSNLAKAIQNLLDVQFQQDILKASGASKALGTYTQYLVNNTQNTKGGQSARATLIKDLEKAGWKSQQATKYVDGLTKSIDKIPSHVHTNITMNGKGQYSVNGTVISGITAQAMSSSAANIFHHSARGWLVTGGTPGVDSVPILAQQGEAVVPKHLVPHIAPMMKAHGVPGFANGGIVGNLGVNWPSNTFQAFEGQFSNAMIRSMQNAMRTVEQQMSGSLGASSVAASVAQAFARALLPSFGWGMGQWAPLVMLWNKESGWNPQARNPSSGAAGIPQDISGNFHGGYQGQVLWGLSYIQGRYGSPSGAWAHEVAYNWYDQGGLLMPGLTLAYNGLGHPEVISPNPPSVGGGNSGGGITVVVNANGLVNPDGIAQEIYQALLAYKQHHGNRSLGLG